MTFTARRSVGWVRRLATAAVALVAIFLLASVMGARVVVAGSRGAFAVPASAISHDHRGVAFPSRVDHVRLSGWLFRADLPSGRSVILVHGWQGNREDVDFVAMTRQLLSRGYDVLMFDLRGSGLSMGSNQTLANTEPRDLLAASDRAFANLCAAMEGGLTRYTFLLGLLAITAIEASRAFGVLPTLSPVDVVR